MNSFLFRYQKLIPYIIVFFGVTFFFTIASFFPYEIQTDVASQLKSVQQWLRGESGLFYSIVIPDPKDLSQNLRSWISWWPPGIAIFFLPLIALGLPLGIAARLTAYGLFMLGCIGWLKVADSLRVNLATKVTLALALPMYSLGYATTYAASNLGCGDILPFGIMPWLFLSAINLTSNSTLSQGKYKHILVNFVGLGFLLGTVYWLKYSAFLGALSILFYVILCFLFFENKYSFKKRFLLLSASAVSCFLPIICLTIINKQLGEVDDAISQMANYISATSNTQGIGLLYSFLGSLGLSLFQTVDGLMHIFYFSDKIFTFLSSYSELERQVFLLIAGIPGTVIVGWSLFYSRKIYSKKIFILGLCVTFIPTVLLVYLSYKADYNFLAGDVARLTSGYFIFTEILLISVYWNFVLNNRHIRGKVFSCLILAVFFILPNLFVLSNFTKNYIVERTGIGYITTENYLYSPRLSKVNAKSVVSQIDSVVKSPKDVIVLAIHYPGAAGTWLEVKHRALPIFDWGFITSTLRDVKDLTTSQDLRLILVISKFLEADGKTFLQVKQRFPQATEWTRVENPTDSDASVSIWFSDLKVL